MKTIKIISVMSFFLGLFAIASEAQTIQSDFDRSFDFSKSKTFKFAVQSRAPGDPLVQNSLNDERIKNALESKLTANGFQIEKGKQPDFTVAYYVTTKKKFDLSESGYGPPRWFGTRDIRLDQHTEGTLIVDIIDTTTNEMVWRGTASGSIELKNIDKKITKSVDKLVKQFLKDTGKKD